MEISSHPITHWIQSGMENPIERQKKFEQRINSNHVNAQDLRTEHTLPIHSTSSRAHRSHRLHNQSFATLVPQYIAESQLAGRQDGAGKVNDASCKPGLAFCNEMLIVGRGELVEKPKGWFW